MGNLGTIFSIFMTDPWSFVLLAFIMVSALIVFIGLFVKPLMKEFVANDDLRGSLLALSSIVMSFVSVAIAFLIHDWNFEYYLWVSAGFSVWTVFVYWLYENTKMRKGIHWLGSFVLKKFTGLSVTSFAELKTALKNMKKEVMPQASIIMNENFASVANYATKKVDEEFKNL